MSTLNRSLRIFRFWRVNSNLTIVCILFLFRNIHSLIQKRAFKKGHIYNMKKDIIHKVFFDNFLVRKKSERKKPFFVCIKEVELKIRLVFVFSKFFTSHSSFDEKWGKISWNWGKLDQPENETKITQIDAIEI